jgi:TfoX/Sxy family transcriptional regulator of competence genes
MAEPYLTQLSQMLEPLQIPGVTLECAHFFSGAALYANGKICASFSPAGFAVKLPEDQRLELIRAGKGENFRFFPKGPIKRDYIALSDPVFEDENELHELVIVSVRYVLESPS